MPNILLRGQNAPIRHCVTPMGANSAICKAIDPPCAPEYRFVSKEGKSLYLFLLSINWTVKNRNGSKGLCSEKRYSFRWRWKVSSPTVQTLSRSHPFCEYGGILRTLTILCWATIRWCIITTLQKSLNGNALSRSHVCIPSSRWYQSN